MDPRASKRTYTVQGLTIGFLSWRRIGRKFHPEIVGVGRSINEAVRAVDFRSGTATFSCETEEEDGYAVVDWNGTAFSSLFGGGGGIGLWQLGL